MARFCNYFDEEKNTGRFQETLWLGLRIYRGIFLNLFGVRVPLFCGHKLTYNCNLRCKMCPFWTRHSEDSSIEREKTILRQIYDSGVCGIAFEGGEPLLRNDLVEILAFSRSLPLHTSLVTNGTLLDSRIDESARALKTKTEATCNTRVKIIILYNYSFYIIATREKDKHSRPTMRSHGLSN